MIFLNPLFLFGLAAAAIPIIIHLLNLRKIRTIEFSTLTFLKELERTQIRRIKLRQLLLLILRTLLIIFIVFAFSRPAFRGSAGVIGAEARTTAAIILDNSASMGTYDERGSLFRQAIDRALDVMEVLRDGDHIILLRQSDLPDATTPSPTADRIRVTRHIQETKLSSRHRPLDSALVVSRDLMELSPHLNAELYIISDMQSAHWLGGRETVFESFDREVKTYVIPLGAGRAENAAIENVSFRSALVEPGKPIAFDVVIRNHGTVDLHDHITSVYLDGVRVAQKNLDITGQAAGSTEFLITPERTGLIHGYVEIEDDAFPPDNRYYFTLMIPERINILLVGSNSDDIQFIRTALSARTGTGTDSVIRTEFSSAENFPAVNLNEYDILIVSNVPAWSDAQADRITRFIEEGGGFILFPGENMDIENYNRTLLVRLGLPSITGVRSYERSGSVRLDRIDYDHPIFSGVFEEQLRGEMTIDRIESPRIQKMLTFESPRPTDAPVIGAAGDNLFLLSARRGYGAVLMYSVQPILQWSDLPLRGIFVPLMHRSVLYASTAEHRDESFTAGETALVTLPASRVLPDAAFTLIHPDNSEERIQPRHLATGGAYQFSIESADEPGVYRIYAGDQPVKSFAVNLHSGESDGDRLEIEETKSMLGEYGLERVQFLEPDTDIAHAVLEGRYGTELWKTFLLLALIAAAAETVLARDAKQRLEDHNQKLSEI
jgi:hypothetical protein